MPRRSIWPFVCSPSAGICCWSGCWAVGHSGSRAFAQADSRPYSLTIGFHTVVMVCSAVELALLQHSLPPALVQPPTCHLLTDPSSREAGIRFTPGDVGSCGGGVLPPSSLKNIVLQRRYLPWTAIVLVLPTVSFGVTIQRPQIVVSRRA